jgi:hypothetical protein
MSQPRQPDGEDRDDPAVEYVRSALQEAAQAHRPARDAMVHRIAAGRAADHRRTSWSLLSARPVGAALAVAVISALSVAAVQLTGDDGHGADVPNPPAARPAAVRSSPPAAQPDATGAQRSRQPSTRPATDQASPSGSSPEETKPSGGASPTGTTARNDVLASVGSMGPNSVDTWSQEDVTITNTKAIVSLTVTVTVALTAEPAYTNGFTTVTNSDVTMTTSRGPTALTYTYVLKKGVTLAPGTYLFAAQFRHGPGRQVTRDSYTIVARTRGAETYAQLVGAFR